jgi:hypothetical protein
MAADSRRGATPQTAIPTTETAAALAQRRGYGPQGKGEPFGLRFVARISLLEVLRTALLAKDQTDEANALGLAVDGLCGLLDELEGLEREGPDHG